MSVWKSCPKNIRLLSARQELGAAVGEAWRGLSDEQRLPYTQRAKASRERYKGQLCTIARNAVAAASADSAPAAARAVSTADNH